MPVDFLTDEQCQTYAKYPDMLTQEQLDKYFYLDDKDKELIEACRRDYNKLGYALQLTTVRFLGTFLPNPIDVPNDVIRYLAKQLTINLPAVNGGSKPRIYGAGLDRPSLANNAHPGLICSKNASSRL